LNIAYEFHVELLETPGTNCVNISVKRPAPLLLVAELAKALVLVVIILAGRATRTGSIVPDVDSAAYNVSLNAAKKEGVMFVLAANARSIVLRGWRGHDLCGNDKEGRDPSCGTHDVKLVMENGQSSI
jgi:hypothetical protein